MSDFFKDYLDMRLAWSIEDAENGTPMLKDIAGNLYRPATEEEQEAYAILNLKEAKIAKLEEGVEKARAYFQLQADMYRSYMV